MTIQQYDTFEPRLAQMNATSKLVKAWESKNAKRALKGGGVSLMALSLAACGGEDDTSADDTVDTTPVADPVADPVVEGSPSVGHDIITGTAGADVTNYFVVQNANGEQTNQFGTGDQINLAGGADVLNAVVQDASPLNDGPSASIAAYLTSVETVNFTALNDSQYADAKYGAADGHEIVGINGAFWLGTDVISSVASDASLTVYNVNTLDAADEYGDVGALTSTMTVRMDHTGNDNFLGQESDMTVLFDEDYLIAGSTTSASDATFFILDQDGAEQGGAASALMHAVDADNRVDAAGETSVFTDSIGISFELNGVVTSVSLTDAQIEAAVAADSYTHTDFVADLNENGGLPDGVTVAVEATTLRTTFLDDGSAYSIPAIVVSSANGGTFSNQSFVSREATGVEFNEYGRFENTDPTTSGQTEINVELEKVGRDGDGGDLIIGGMEDSGIQVFNVEVQGRADQPTSLASLASTNNTLEEVNVVAAAGSKASLEIGNGNTDDGGAVGIEVLDSQGYFVGWTYAGTASAANNALVDVRVFDAASFDNGVTVHASVTDDSVAKYMKLEDTAGNSSADNADFAYTTGAGADAVNLVISEANLAASGTANREDFSMAVSTGAGNDSITMQIGDGDMGANAYANHALMDANADSRIGVDAGAGDDMVHTNGSTIFRIDAGAGNDAVYTDNSATGATWVLNAATGNTNVDDLISDENNDVSLYQQVVTLTYKGYAVTTTVADMNTTDLEFNNIIKDLIQSDEHLSDLLVAEDGPGNTLVVSSLIDGLHGVTDFAVGITETDISAMSDATIALFNTANGLTGDSALTTAAEVQNFVTLDVAAWNNEGDYASVLGTNSGAATLAGVNSASVNGNTITDGTGEDTIVLSTHAGSSETVVLVADGEHDMVVNFTFGTAPGTGGDTLDYSSIGLEFNSNTVVTVDSNYSDASGAVDANGAATNTVEIADMVDGAVVLDDTLAGNDTLAEIQALFTAADSAAGTATTSLYVTIDDANREATIYQVEDGAAASDVTVSLVDVVTFDTDIGGALVAGNLGLIA